MTMDTRELIQVEMNRMSDEQLDELYAVARQLVNTQHQSPKTPTGSIFTALKHIRIQGPADLSTTYERYMGRDADDGPDLC